MSPTPISLIPESIDLKLYGGDGVELRLVVTDSQGAPLPLTGSIDAQIRPTRTASVESAVFAADLTDAATGVVILSLTGAQTEALHGSDPDFPTERFTGVWDVQWTPQGAEPVTIVQGTVESALDVTRLP
jgi:hypothetical protein